METAEKPCQTCGDSYPEVKTCPDCGPYPYYPRAAAELISETRALPTGERTVEMDMVAELVGLAADTANDFFWGDVDDGEREEPSAQNLQSELQAEVVKDINEGLDDLIRMAQRAKERINEGANERTT